MEAKGTEGIHPDRPESFRLPSRTGETEWGAGKQEESDSLEMEG